MDTNTQSTNIPPPPFANSINELRSLSTALSTFLNRYDELNNHLNFINLSIDAKLPSSSLVDDSLNPNCSPFTRLIESFCDRNVTDVTERIPNGTVSDCELVSENVRPSDLENGEIECLDPNQSPSLIESCCDGNVTDVTERNTNGAVSICERRSELVSESVRPSDSENGEIDSLNECDEVDILKECDDFDVSKTLLESETDVLKNSEGIDISNKIVEDVVGTMKDCDDMDVSQTVLETDADVLKDVEVIDVSNKILESDYDVLKESEGTDVSEEFLETDTLKIDKEIDVSKNNGEIDVSEKFVGTDTMKIDEEIDVSNKVLETDTLKIGEETDVSKKSLETDSDVLMDFEEIDVSRKLVETDSDVLMNSDEMDVSDELLETDSDVLKDSGGFDISRKLVEAETDVLKDSEAIDVSKNSEEGDVLKKHEEADTLNINEETDVSKIDEETDIHEEISKEYEENDILMNQEVIDTSMDHEELETSMNREEIDTLKQHEKTDLSVDHEETDSLKNNVEADFSKKQEEIDTLKKQEESDDVKRHKEIVVSREPKKRNSQKTKSAYSELETLCARMNAKGLKKYVIIHITDMNKLQEELPKALKLAKYPAKLVLDSVGRFFLQNSKKYPHELFVSRLASVMILECFVMISSDGIEISKEDKAYAAESALKWKQRMVKEGGVRHMEEADARGLLLLISGFGIRDCDFKIVDIKDLIMASNVKGISAALRRSIILIPKIPEVIDMMVKNNLEIEAADTAYTFGLEDKCHPLIILTRFLRNIIIDIQNGSPSQNLMAMNQQLSDLKSVKRCLEFHKVDPSYHLPDFKINERIEHLEKEINNRNLTPKRKSTEPGILGNPKPDEAKRACFSREHMPHVQQPVGHYPMNPYNRPAEPHNSYSNYALAHSYGTHVYVGAVSGQMAPTANVQPYGSHGNPPYLVNDMGQPYSGQSQTYISQPYGTPQLGPFPGYPARRGPASDLYSFADKV